MTTAATTHSYSKRWRKADGTEVVYRYRYRHYTPVARCWKYLRGGGELVRLPTGKGRNGLWIGRGCKYRFQPRTVKTLIAKGYAVLCDDGKIRRKR